MPEYGTNSQREGKKTDPGSVQYGSNTSELTLLVAGGRVPCYLLVRLLAMEGTENQTVGGALVGELPRVGTEGPFCTKRDWLIRLFEAWKRVTMDGVLRYLEENWRDANRCHICNYIGQVSYPQLCPQCGARNRLSDIRLPLQRCHQCPFIGNPAFGQECPLCERESTLSLYMVRKLYESQIRPSSHREQ